MIVFGDNTIFGSYFDRSTDPWIRPILPYIEKYIFTSIGIREDDGLDISEIPCCEPQSYTDDFLAKNSICEGIILDGPLSHDDMFVGEVFGVVEIDEGVDRSWESDKCKDKKGNFFHKLSNICDKRSIGNMGDIQASWVAFERVVV